MARVGFLRGGAISAGLLLALIAPRPGPAADSPPALASPVPASHVLDVSDMNGRRLFAAPVAEGRGWCVLWNHSVAGFPVRDCYRVEDGRMLLDSSHQPDFAAGLGHIPGRGELRGDGTGGYVIEAINEPVPGNCYRLRTGDMWVNHRIRLDDGREESLSAQAARQAVRVTLRPAVDPEDEGGRPC